MHRKANKHNISSRMFLLFAVCCVLQVQNVFAQTTNNSRRKSNTFELKGTKGISFDKNKYSEIFITPQLKVTPSCITDTAFGIKLMSEAQMKDIIASLTNSNDTCLCNNEYAQIVFNRRLEIIDSCYTLHCYEEMYNDIRCLINNLDLISGHTTEPVGNYVGAIWFNRMFFDFYSEWFEQNKSRLCYDRASKLLYIIPSSTQ